MSPTVTMTDHMLFDLLIARYRDAVMAAVGIDDAFLADEANETDPRYEEYYQTLEQVVSRVILNLRAAGLIEFATVQ